MMKENKFDWVNFYEEFAQVLRKYKDNRHELIEKVRRIYEVTGIAMPTLERDNQIVDIDPFTVIGLFSKGLGENSRKRVIAAIADIFGLTNPIPTDFSGIPVVNPQNATFYYFLGDRGDNDINELWELFEYALQYVENPTCKRIITQFLQLLC
jgi:5-methylcytosine-specific restriction protein B